jgi:hypothetical protein
MEMSPQRVAERRQWLADLLCGRSPNAATAPFIDDVDVVQSARAEGVLALLADRLQARPAADPLRRAVVAAARGTTVIAMLREAECRRVLALLHAAGIPVLLLKGSALAWWLYPSPHLRECSDVDLLFASREAVAQAARLLAANGYDRGYVQGEQAYELVCRRVLSASFVLDVDLHWALNNAPVFAHAFDFDALSKASIALPALAPNARGLSPVHALAHACMHRAINLYTGVGDNLKWLYDLHLLAQRLTPSEWDELRACGEATGLGSVCAAGLQAAAEVFGDAAPADVLASLRASDGFDGGRVDGNRVHDWRYMHRMNLRALPSLRARMHWLWRKLVPTLPHLRAMHGPAKSVPALWAARARHLLRKVR